MSNAQIARLEQMILALQAQVGELTEIAQHLAEQSHKPKRVNAGPITRQVGNEIKRLALDGMSGAQISRQLGISETTISLVKNNKYPYRR